MRNSLPPLEIKCNVDSLIGKWIIFAAIMGYKELDDEPSLLLTMDDNTQFYINAGYGGYTGKSENEYPVFIDVHQEH